MPFDPIHTERLILREWRESDHAPYISMNSDEDVMRYFPALQSAEETLAQIQRFKMFMKAHGYCFWALERKDTGEFIGFTGLSQPRFESFFTPCMEIGWRLAKAHWHQGFATEAALAALQFAFDELQASEVYSFTSVLNKPSEQVMKRIGMKEAGYFDHPLLPEGHRLSRHVLYRIIKTER